MNERDENEEEQDAPNDTPDDRRSPEHRGRRANEAAILVIIAHAMNVGEHPSLNTELNGASDDGGNGLTPEHRTRPIQERLVSRSLMQSNDSYSRNLHIMTELEVRRELQGLHHRDVSPSLSSNEKSQAYLSIEIRECLP